VEECGTCHVIEGLTKGGMRKAPQIYGWGSPWWIGRMIRDPRSSDRYAFLNEKLPGQMPAFGEDQLSRGDMEALIRYLKGDFAKP
jgi:mono/diheme cytochrome c family protein